MQPYQYFDGFRKGEKSDYSLISRWYKQIIVLILISLVLLSIAFKASVCTGEFEGDSRAVCERIIK